MTERSAQWLRVSSTSQDEAMQEPDIAKHIEGRGYISGPTYRLRASASKGKHQDLLDKVLADARASKFDVLVVWLPDRLERRGAFRSIHWLQEVMDAGVRVEFAEPTRGHRYDLSTPRGQEELARAASYAAEESELRQTRVNAGRNLAKAKGGILTIPPFGYAVVGDKHAKRFEATADGKKWVPVVFERASEMSLHKLRASLKGTPLEGRTVTGLANMIRNRTYLGYIQAADGTVIGRCEPLVRAGLWNKANKALAERPHAGGRPATKYVPAQLKGVIVCPHCQHSMYKTPQGPKGRQYLYYRCRQQVGGCGYAVRLEIADALADEAVSELNSEITVRTLVERGHDWSEEIATTELELRQLASLGLDYDAEDAERARLRAELTRLRALPATDDRWEDVGTGHTYASRWSALGTDERNAWLRSAEVKFFVSKDASAIPALITELTAKLATGNDLRYSVKTRDGVTLVVYFGSMAKLSEAA